MFRRIVAAFLLWTCLWGCSTRRFVRVEADRITVQMSTASVLSGIPAIEASGFRMWKATGDKRLEVPAEFFDPARGVVDPSPPLESSDVSSGPLTPMEGF